jgi:hypothetical protein
MTSIFYFVELDLHSLVKYTLVKLFFMLLLDHRLHFLSDYFHQRLKSLLDKNFQESEVACSFLALLLSFL